MNRQVYIEYLVIFNCHIDALLLTVQAVVCGFL